MESRKGQGSMRTGQGQQSPVIDIAQTIQKGEPPSNEQVNAVLETTKQAIQEESSRKGKKETVVFAKHAKAFLDSTEVFINEKNKEQQVQRFIKDTKEASKELSEELKHLPTPQVDASIDKGTKEEIKQRGEEMRVSAADSVRAMKELVLMLIDSYEFRSLLVDFVGWIQDAAYKEKELASHQPPEISKEEEKRQALEGKPLSEEVKEKTEQAKEFGKEVAQDLREGKLPVDQQRKEELKNRFKELLKRFSNDERFNRALRGLFYIFDQANTVGSRVAERTLEKTEGTAVEAKDKIASNEHVWKMWDDGRSLMEQFTGKEALDKFLDNLWELIQLARQDDDLNRFFCDSRDFIMRTLHDPTLLQNDEHFNKADTLIDRSRDWMNDPRYKGRINTLWEDFNTLIENIKHDETRLRLAEDINVLAHDLFLDETGQPSLQVTQQGLTKVQSLLGPIVRKNLEFISFPIITGSDETYDWEIRDFNLRGGDIIPEHVFLRVWTDAQLSTGDLPSKSITYMTAWVRNIGLNAQNIKFHFKRKTIPKLDDKGIADFKIYGANTQIRATWKLEGEQAKGWNFALHSVRAYIDHLNIHIKESNHSFLNKMIVSMFNSTIKTRIEHNIEENLSTAFGTVNNQLADVLKTQA